MKHSIHPEAARRQDRLFLWALAACAVATLLVIVLVPEAK